MAKTSMIVKAAIASRSSLLVSTRAASAAAVRTLCTASSACAVSASRELALKGELPGVKKASW